MAYSEGQTSKPPCAGSRRGWPTKSTWNTSSVGMFVKHQPGGSKNTHPRSREAPGSACVAAPRSPRGAGWLGLPSACACEIAARHRGGRAYPAGNAWCLESNELKVLLVPQVASGTLNHGTCPGCQCSVNTSFTQIQKHQLLLLRNTPICFSVPSKSLLRQFLDRLMVPFPSCSVWKSVLVSRLSGNYKTFNFRSIKLCSRAVVVVTCANSIL